jgi:cupin 2 domain-containing protein
MESVQGNIFKAIKADNEQEIFEDILTKGSVRIERIISSSQSSPEGFWYDQQQHEWVMVLEGRAEIEFEDGLRAQLSRGDYLFIEAHRRHRVVSTSSDEVTLWLAVHIKTDL